VGDLAGRFALIDGLWWPAGDRTGRQALLALAQDIDQLMRHVRGRRFCVQAGGNCGVWPIRLAELFECVHTFEPDDDNFFCLQRNCTAPNVMQHRAALGDADRLVGIEKHWQNCGMHHVVSGCDVPMQTIDGLGLDNCDLIYLDVEGYEWQALLGAQTTVARTRPVIAIESKDHSERYGIPKERVERYVISLGYRLVDRVHHDVIFAPEEHCG
jgi:FkbM family methyltransferase